MSEIADRLRLQSEPERALSIRISDLEEAANLIDQLEEGLTWMLKNWSVLIMYLDEEGVVNELNRLRTLVGLEPNVTLADLSA